MGKPVDRASGARTRSATRVRRVQRVTAASSNPAAGVAIASPAVVAPPQPFVPQVRRSGRAAPNGEGPGPKPGKANAQRRPTAVQLGTDIRTVAWSADRFEDLKVVSGDIAAELDATPPGRAADMLRVLLRIATGEWPRPTYYEPVTGRHLTSVRMLAPLSGMSKFFAYGDIEVVDVLDRWLPRLADAPGYPVRVLGRSPEPHKPIQAKVMLALDAAERAGMRIPEAHNRGASVIGFCEGNGLSYHEVSSHELSIRQITEAAKRPGALGEKYKPLFKGPEYRQDTVRVVAWMQRLFDDGKPLPGRPDKPEIVDTEYIEREAGVTGRPVVMAKAVQDHIASHRAAFGVEARKEMTIPVATCGDFKGSARDWFEAEHGTKQLNNTMTALNRVYAARELAPDSPFPKALFADLVTLQSDAAAVAPPMKAARNLKVPLEVLRGYARRFADAPDDGLPASAHGALDFAIRRWGGRITELETATGIPASLLGLLRTGQQAIPQRYVDCLPALDEVLATGDGLYRRFEPDATFRLCDCSALYRSLEARIRNLLPTGAHKLSDEALLPLIRNVNQNAIRQNRMYSKVLSAARVFWGSIPNVPSDAPVLEEIRLLIRHKTMAVPDDAKRRAKRGAWSKDARKMNRTHLLRFARFALLGRERGGLGLAVEDVSLALFQNWRILAAYMEFLSRRYEHVEHDGERRGPLLTVYDLLTLQLAATLLGPEYGWVQQRSDIFKKRIRELPGALGPFPGLEEIRVRHSGDTDEEIDVEEIEELLSASTRLFQATMPAEVVKAANRSWLKASIDARDKINNLRTYLLALVDTSRSPFEPIQNIVDDPKPLNFLRDIAQAAQDDLPDIVLDPVGHATAVRNLLMFVLLSLTALRSKNLRQLLYDPKRGGHISVNGDDQIVIKIPWENFKNLGSWRLFGIPGFKFDYEKLIHDWFNVKALFEHYVRNCRPLLIAHFAKRLKRTALAKRKPVAGLPTDTNALFPIPSLGRMDENEFGTIIRAMTRDYHVIDPKTGLVRPDHMFFGPHAVRDILATHIVMSSDDPSRWEEAADLLQTSIAMVQLRYTKRKVINRLAKTDRHFDEASVGFKARAFA